MDIPSPGVCIIKKATSHCLKTFCHSRTRFASNSPANALALTRPRPPASCLSSTAKFLPISCNNFFTDTCCHYMISFKMADEILCNPWGFKTIPGTLWFPLVTTLLSTLVIYCTIKPFRYKYIELKRNKRSSISYYNWLPLSAIRLPSIYSKLHHVCA